jgi:hypothetical protein
MKRLAQAKTNKTTSGIFTKTTAEKLACMNAHVHCAQTNMRDCSSNQIGKIQEKNLTYAYKEIDDLAQIKAVRVQLTTRWNKQLQRLN